MGLVPDVDPGYQAHRQFLGLFFSQASDMNGT
jgi:hypothetical protein